MFSLSNLCFLCLNSSTNLKPVLTENNEEILMEKQLKYCLPEMDVDFLTEIPKYICSNCISKLECLYKFKETCLQNNIYLKNYIQTVTSRYGSNKQLSVKLPDIECQNKLQTINSYHTLSDIGSDELRTGEKENNVFKNEMCADISHIQESHSEFLTSDHNVDNEYAKSIRNDSDGTCIIRAEVSKTKIMCADELDIEKSHSFFEEEHNIVRQESLAYENNVEDEYVKSIKHESIQIDSDRTCIKGTKEVFNNDIEESHSLFKEENEIDVKEEFLTSEKNIDEYFENIKSNSIPNDSDGTCIEGAKEIFKKEIMCADVLDIEDSHSVFEEENEVVIKEEFLTSEKNVNDDCHKSIKRESIPSDSDGTCIKEAEQIFNSDVLDIEKSHSFCKQEYDVDVKEEFFTSEDNVGDEYVKSTKCEFISSDSEGTCNKGAELVKNKLMRADVLDFKEPHSFFQEKKDVKEENLTSEDNVDNQYMESIKCESIQNDSDVSVSSIEDVVQENSKFCNGSSENTSTEPEDNNIKKNKTFHCAICSKEFLHKYTLGNHLKLHAGIKNFECSVCKKQFVSKSVLVKHEIIHTGIKDFECSICKKQFLFKDVLIAHEKIHSGIRNFQCSICKKKFISKGHLVRHEKIHIIQDFECSVCRKMFMCKSDLLKHKKIHIVKKIFECSVCKRKFVFKNAWIKHEKSHSENSLECSICRKKFLRKCNLVAHEKIHTNIKDFECLICKRKFKFKGELRKHENIHTGIKKFECLICNKKFYFKYAVVQHEKIHIGVRNFECSICGKKFMHKSNMITHEKNHTCIKKTLN